MNSSRRIAQFGLASASLLLVGSVAILVAGNAGASSEVTNSTGFRLLPSQSSNSMASFEAQIPQPMLVAKN